MSEGQEGACEASLITLIWFFTNGIGLALENIHLSKKHDLKPIECLVLIELYTLFLKGREVTQAELSKTRFPFKDLAITIRFLEIRGLIVRVPIIVKKQGRRPRALQLTPAGIDMGIMLYRFSERIEQVLITHGITHGLLHSIVIELMRASGSAPAKAIQRYDSMDTLRRRRRSLHITKGRKERLRLQ